MQLSLVLLGGGCLCSKFDIAFLDLAANEGGRLLLLVPLSFAIDTRPPLVVVREAAVFGRTDPKNRNCASTVVLHGRLDTILLDDGSILGAWTSGLLWGRGLVGVALLWHPWW